MRRLNCVLLVDDDKVNNYLNERLIRNLDIARKVQIALNGEEALLYLTRHGTTFDLNFPELILLDYEMPQMEGSEFMELFNRINTNNIHRAKIAVLTSSVNPKVKDKMLSLGIDEYLEKPLTKEKLEVLLKDLQTDV